MSKINTNTLFEQDTCYFQKKQKKGKVLAVSTYHTHRRICFLIQGEEWGTWVDESALFSGSNIEQNSIEKENKLNTAKDESREKGIIFTDIQINNRLTIIFKGSVKVIKFVKSIVSELWNRYWKDRIVNSLTNKNLDISNSRETVTNLKRDYPDRNNYKIAEQLILEKSLFATITSLVKEIPGVNSITSIPIIKRRVEFLNVENLIVEIVDQIAFTYGYEQISDSEFLSISAIVFNKSVLLNFGLQSLIESKTPKWEINAISSMFLLTIIGYAAREFYEAKTKLNKSPLHIEKEFMSIKDQVEKDSLTIANQKNEFENRLQSKLGNFEKQTILT